MSQSSNAEVTGQFFVDRVNTLVSFYLNGMPYCTVIERSLDQQSILGFKPSTEHTESVIIDPLFSWYDADDESDFTRPTSKRTKVFRKRNEFHVDEISLESLDSFFEHEGIVIDQAPITRRESSARSNKKETRRRDFLRRQSKIKPHMLENFDFSNVRERMSKIVLNTTGFDNISCDYINEISKAREYMKGVADEKTVSEWVGYLESVALFAYNVSKANSLLDVFMSVVGYVKMEYKNPSIVTDLYSIMNDLLEQHTSPHVFEDWDGQRIVDTWELLKTNTIFTSISYLISAAMSLGICASKRIEWSLAGFKLVAIEAAKEQLSAVDVLDACIKTMTWFYETGSRCIEQKSLLPLLYSDQTVQEYNSEYADVIAQADHAIAGNVEDLGDYEKRVDKLLVRSSELKSAKSTGPTALWVQSHYVSLMSIKQKLVAKRKGTDIRYAPIGFSLYGGTSVGKSTLGKLTMISSLAAQGCHDDDGIVDSSRIITLDMFDKYQSTYTSDILGVFLDDVGNTRAEFARENPHTSVIIKFFNNVAAQAIKAELNAKGVVFIDFKTGIITTNKKDLDARCYSNCPESILRRFYHVNVSVKQQYRMPGSTMLNKAHPDILAAPDLEFDVWDLSIEEVTTREVGIVNGEPKYAYDFKILTLPDGTVCENMGLRDYLRAVSVLSKNHKIEQETLIKKTKLVAQCHVCKKCKMLPKFCSCKEVDPHSLVGDMFFSAAKQAIASYFLQWFQPFTFLGALFGYYPIKFSATKMLAAEMKRALDRNFVPSLLAVLPQYVLDLPSCERLLEWWVKQNAVWKIPRLLFPFTFLSCFISLYFFVYGRLFQGCIFAFMAAILTCTIYNAYETRMLQVRHAYLARRDALTVYLNDVKSSNIARNALIVAAMGLGVRMIYAWNKNRVRMIHAHMSPEDVDSQPGWFGYLANSLSFKAKSDVKGSIPEHVEAVVASHLGRAEFQSPDGRVVNCNIVYPMKGVIWFPRHIFYPKEDMSCEPYSHVNVRVKRSDANTSQFRFVAELGVNTIFHESLDLVAAFAARCPDIRDNFIQHLTSSIHTRGVTIGNMYVRAKNGSLQSDTFTVSFGKSGHKFLSFPGGNYNTKLAVHGSCMAPVVSEGKSPAICGFHMGGDGTGYGVMMTITKDQASSFIMTLLDLPGVRGMNQATEIPSTQYGIEVRKSVHVDPKAKFVKGLDNTAEIDVFGSTRVRQQMKSRVEQSYISPHVAKHFGIRNTWGPPKLIPNWDAFNKTLVHIVKPSAPFLPSLLERARQDWVQPIIAFAREYNMKEKICPLNDREMVLGAPGKRFIDALPMNTSMGFPVFGTKDKHFEEIRDGEVLIDRIPSPEVLAEMARMEACWRRGERAYPVTTATLKDEPTPVDKEKVRVFQAVAVGFGLFIRKYYLPIARVLSLNPLLSESAVGVNAFGKQWEELMDYSEKFSGDEQRVLAWDYSKYDVRMGADVIYAVLMSFIDIAEACDYSKDDLFMMNAMVADMIHPLIDYNGTMLMAYNLNTSGNNITVNINGAAGSLYVRMGFFDALPHIEDFRSNVALITYGDDAKASLREELRNKFNFLVYREFLNKHDMVVTLPDKGENVSLDLGVEEADFLKRQSQYIPEIDRKIGKLAESSIFKSLHSNLKSKTTSYREVAVSCIETAMHEWFAHGRKIYEARQEKMKLVCQDAHLPIPAVHLTFDERVKLWLDKYSD